MTKFRFPSIRELSEKILTAKVRGSIGYIHAHCAEIKRFGDVEDFVYELVECPTATLRGIAHHLSIVSSYTTQSLWEAGIFIGSSVVDQIIFVRLRGGSGENSVEEALAFLRDTGLHKGGMVVYPLHSFGIYSAGILKWINKGTISLELLDAGLVVRPQTNALDETIEFMNSAAEALGLGCSVPKSLVHHYSRSRPTKWLTHNPLLILRCHTFSGTYYENQEFLVLKLQFATTLLFMMMAFQHGISKKTAGALFSSRRVNNFQTLDIHHYFLLERKPGRKKHFDLRCVPMHVQPAELAELSDVNIEIIPQLWTRRKPIVKRIASSLKAVEEGYVKYSLLVGKSTVRSRIYRKLTNSLAYFRRSFRASADRGAAIVNLAVALEVLLVDFYSPGVSERVPEHLSRALRGIQGQGIFTAEVRKLYVARSQSVHTAEIDQEVDMEIARQAFVHAFIAIARRLPRLNTSAQEPIKKLLQS